tara:strand:- start:702 stop:989 length:288 start_codon:yes stop_codon:yes gene_type:complete
LEGLDLAKSGFGAVLGFFLAQLVNLARVYRDERRKPKLAIEPDETPSLVLSHTKEISPWEPYREKVYGVVVRNTGRSIATGVHFQVIKIECRDRD